MSICVANPNAKYTTREIKKSKIQFWNPLKKAETQLPSLHVIHGVVVDIRRRQQYDLHVRQIDFH